MDGVLFDLIWQVTFTMRLQSGAVRLDYPVAYQTQEAEPSVFDPQIPKFNDVSYQRIHWAHVP